MTPIDFIGNFILGGIIGGVIYNHAITFAEYASVLLVTFAIVSGLNYLTSKFMPTRAIVMGRAYTIIENGRFTQDALDSPDHQFDPVEFLAEMQEKGIFSLSEVDRAQREANGSLTVRKVGEGGLNFLLVSNGQIVSGAMELAHCDEEWLRAELTRAGIDSLDDLFLVELDAFNRLNIVASDGQTTSIPASNQAVTEGTTAARFQCVPEGQATPEDTRADDARPGHHQTASGSDD